MKKALKEDDQPRVRRSAAFALGAFGPEAAPARDDLIAASKDASAIVRQNAAWALGKLGKAAGEDGVEQPSSLQDDEPWCAATRCTRWARSAIPQPIPP